MTTTTTFPNRPQQYEPTPEDMEQLAAQWRAGISDPAPCEGTLYDWLRRYGKSICHNSVAACIRKYRYLHSQHTPMEYGHAVRYTASCARNARNAANEFRAPKEWTEPALAFDSRHWPWLPHHGIAPHSVATVQRCTAIDHRHK
jgi:hypothetical protein